MENIEKKWSDLFSEIGMAQILLPNNSKIIDGETIDSFNLNDKLAKIFPLPQPISKILESLSSFTCFNIKLLKELIYFCDDNQVLLSQFFNCFIKELL